MDNKPIKDQPDMEHLRLILQEVSKDLQDINKGNSDIITALNLLTEKVNQVEQKPEETKVPVCTDTRPIEDIIEKGIIDIKLVAAAQPKTVVRKFQILLFPEQDAKLFYKVVFGRWLILLTAMLFLVNVCKFGVHWSDNQKEIKIQQMENAQIKKAWNFLYYQHGKNVRRLMDSAYIKSNQKERIQVYHSH